MDKLKEPVIDFPIERINKFLDEYIFEVPAFNDVRLPVKVKIIGMKNLISVGDWTPFIVYEFYVLFGNKSQNLLSSIWFGDPYTKETPFVISLNKRNSDELRMNLNVLLKNFLQYWGINYGVTCGGGFSNVPYNLPPENIKESLILEGKYDSVVRHIVKDIVNIVRYGQSGEFSLPEDISGSEDMTYEFPQLETNFSVELTITEDESIDYYKIDSEYYRDEDVIELGIILNPNLGRTLIQDLIGDLNETLMHEIVHIGQHEKGYDFPEDEDLTPLEYYTQEHELEAQFMGFKRRAKREHRTIDSVMDDWFDTNEDLHRLTPEEVEIVKEKIMDLYY
jgi:hypothetical protein